MFTILLRRRLHVILIWKIRFCRNFYNGLLTYVKIGAFTGLNQLQSLNLGYNRITVIDNGAFAGLSLLQTLLVVVMTMIIIIIIVVIIIYNYYYYYYYYYC